MTRSLKQNFLKEYDIKVIDNQVCPVCKKRSLTLRDITTKIPNFGVVFIYSMECHNCKFYRSDIEFEKKAEVRYCINVENEKDLYIKIAKSSNAKVKIGNIITIEPGPASQGYITNVEGLLRRVKRVLEIKYKDEDDQKKRSKLKRMIKKINNVMMGRDKIRIIITDPTGNSAVISEKAIKNQKQNKKG